MKKQIETLTLLLNSTIEGIVVFDRERRAIRVNRVFASFFGYEEAEILGMNAIDFIAPESRELVRSKILISDQEPYEALMLRKDGSKFWAIVRGKNVVLDGEPVRISSVLDISALKEKEARILYLANHDPLTGTYNRRFFQEMLSQKIESLKREKHYGAILFIDLDNFKEINDTLGHDAGDRVLRTTAERIRTHIRKSDMVARIGGDEFVILLNLEAGSSEEAAFRSDLTGEKILSLIGQPIILTGGRVDVGASIGITVIDGTSSSDDLMKFADVAMYEAKKRGKNRIVFYDRSLEESMARRIRTLTDLRKGLETNALFLLYQPQVRIKEDGEPQTVGVEALVRWRRDGEPVSPAEFIPLAEESGTIVALGGYVLGQAARTLHRWSGDERKRSWRISVNISPRQFEEPAFVQRVADVIALYLLDPKKLRLELTENLLLKNFEESFEKIRKLKELGVSLSIDDFGTGFSSLMYLKKLPVDELKVDRSFIRDIENDESDRIIVETIVSLGKKFGLEVIAEGVETPEQLKIVRSLGIDFVQGYLFGRPCADDEL